MKRIIALVSLVFLPLSALADAKVGEPAPGFTAKDTRGKVQTLEQYKGQVVVLEWTNPECPFVKKHYESDNMQQTQRFARQNEVVWLSIDSSAPGKQGNLTEEEANKWRKAQKAASEAMILDETGIIGHAYGAKTTPHIFIIDQKGVLAYAGAIDDVPSGDQGDIKKAKNLAIQAMEELAAGKTVSQPVTQPYGCSVKY